MKITVGLLLIMVSVTFPQAQKAVVTQPPDVTILSSSWEQYARRIRLSPSDTMGETSEERRARVKREMSNDAARNIPGVKPAPVKSTPIKALPKSTEEGYLYKASVKNSGAKTIKSVGWAYIFIDPGSGEELGRHRFQTRKNIRPGQVKELAEFEYSPPSRLVSVAGLGKDVAKPFVERVAITRVEYADGTLWQIKEVD